MSGVAAASDALISDSTRRSTSVAKSRSPLPINAPMCERPCRSVRAPMSIACSAASVVSPSRNRRPLPSRHHRTRSPPGSYRDGRAREHRADDSGVASLDVGANDDRQTRVGSQQLTRPADRPERSPGGIDRAQRITTYSRWGQLAQTRHMQESLRRNRIPGLRDHDRLIALRSGTRMREPSRESDRARRQAQRGARHGRARHAPVKCTETAGQLPVLSRCARWGLRRHRVR